MNEYTLVWNFAVDSMLDIEYTTVYESLIKSQFLYLKPIWARVNTRQRFSPEYSTVEPKAKLSQ